MLFNIARETQFLRILRGKMKQNMIFSVQFFFQNLLFKQKLFFKIVLFKNISSFKIMLLNQKFCSKIWRVVIFLIPNLTRSKKFNSGSDTLLSFLFKIMLSKSSFQILATLLSECYQHHKTYFWKKTMAWGKKIFYKCLACVCLTLGTIFLTMAFSMAIGFLMGVMIVSFALPIDL